MKKLRLFLTLVLWGFAQVAEAQNMYRNYRSTNVQVVKKIIKSGK